MKTFIVAISIGLMLTAYAGAQSLRKEGGSGQVAPLATTDPYKVVYRVTGVTDDGDASNAGVATSIMCTNFSQSTEYVQYNVLRYSGSEAMVIFGTVFLRGTITASTHYTNIFYDGVNLNTGAMNQGSIVVSSTTINIHCTAMIVDAASTVPNGIALHMVRFNPHPGSVE